MKPTSAPSILPSSAMSFPVFFWLSLARIASLKVSFYESKLKFYFNYLLHVAFSGKNLPFCAAAATASRLLLRSQSGRRWRGRRRTASRTDRQTVSSRLWSELQEGDKKKIIIYRFYFLSKFVGNKYKMRGSECWLVYCKCKTTSWKIYTVIYQWRYNWQQFYLDFFIKY